MRHISHITLLNMYSMCVYCSSTFLNGGKIKNKDAEESTKANNAIDALIGDSDLLKEAATLLGKGQMSNTLISLLGGLNGSKDKDKKGALASLAGL